ncbi:MAG: Ig-like domain-containing protein [Acidobacteriota bacterium]
MSNRVRIITLAVGFIALAVWSQAALSHAARCWMMGFFKRPLERPSIRFHPSGEVSVEGLRSLDRLKDKNLSREEWASLFGVYTGEQIPADMPPMLGEYLIERDAIRFHPRFPLVVGLQYTARFDVSLFASMTQSNVSDQSPVIASFALPKSEATLTRVAAVYPSADRLPANQLKLYIEFSAPMSMGVAYDHIHLFDERGRELPKAFLRLQQELWDESRKRLTLWFDPGRIKRGLRPNVEMGEPLTEGRSYRLVIDRSWLDAEGNAMAESFEKKFTVAPSDRQPPDPATWQLAAPRAGTREPVRLVFSEPLDRALLESKLDLLDDHRNRLEGAVEIINDEREWRFTPASEWAEGSYSILIDSAIEDLAGNNLRRSFDIDLKKSSPVLSQAEKVVLRLTVAGANP